MQKTPLLFYASRADGLGGRLRAIMNAQVLAGRFGGRFGFLWGDMAATEDMAQHSIAPVLETFSPDFAAAHHIDKRHLDGMQTMPLGKATRAPDRDGAFARGIDAIEVGQVDLSYQGVAFPPGAARTALLRKAWGDLQFAPALEAARRAAGSVGFPARASAIHLRAGDIIYGNHRMLDRFHSKASSWPIIEEMVRNQIREGFTPVLFGQDLALCRYLRDRHGALLATDLTVGYDFDKNQQAIFDIVVMSRCERIYAERSGFAVLAAWIAGVQRSSPLFNYRADEKVALIEAALFAETPVADISPQQRAFACRNAFVMAGIHFPSEPRFQRLLDHAREMDPENDFYHFVQAVACYASGDAKTAEAMIGALLLSEKTTFLRAFFLKRSDEPRFEVDPYLPLLTQQAELGHAMAALFVSRAYEARRDTAKAGYFAALFQTGSQATRAQ
jgi:hypothetical protein